MTIERQDSIVEYTITSADSERVEFPFDFPTKNTRYIHCYDITPTATTGQTDIVTPIPASGYIVTLMNPSVGAGGSVTLASPIVVGHRFRIQRQTEMVQKKEFHNQDWINPAEIEDALDRLTMIDQEQGGRIAGLEEDVENLYVDTSDLDADLRAEVLARQQGDSSLQSQFTAAIQTEVQARQQADASLDSRKAERSELAAEAATRASADVNLQSQINTKSNASDLAAEVSARIMADILLQARIDTKADASITESGLAGKAPLNHAGRHAIGGGDTVTPASIGALGVGHVAEADPHPQYVTKGNYGVEKFFVFDPVTGLLRLKETANVGDETSFFVMTGSGLVSLKGTTNG